jgi:N-acyl-D-amino-acid deacylase
MDNHHDLVIRNASVFDGSGRDGLAADIAINGDRIAAVGKIDARGGIELDARGLAVAPGFIDVHSHDDVAMLVSPEMDFKVMQGVTTDVVGNCGLGAAPYEMLVRHFGIFFGDSTPPRWEGYAGYLAALDKDPASINAAVLVGHNTIRFAAMGNEKRAPSEAELSKMREMVREGIEAGAVGFSTGLVYEPGRYSETEEIIELAREAGRGGALYATHMRNEAERLLDAIRETIRIAEEGDVAAQVSHHKASGRANWGAVRESLRLIEEARARGVDITADQYPYTAGSTSLFAILQNGAFSPESEHGGVGSLEPESVLIAGAPGHPEYEGMSVAELSASMGLKPLAASNRVLSETGGRAIAIMETMNEDDVRTVMRHPTTMIGSDGIPAAGKPHPRLYGTFPRVLGRYVREQKLMPMADAIHRMTGMPAAKFRLKGRGAIEPGAFADLVVFNPASIRDVGTYDDPRRYPEGISHVFVNGVAVVKDGAHTGARPGRALRRG